ncbi:MAG: serine hydrolase [Actinomycetota bacterium]
MIRDMSLDDWIEEQRKAFEVPGLAVGVIHDAKTVLSRGFGLRDVAGGLPVTPDTGFGIASVTKAFTAAAVGALVDDGLVEWDRPVREYIPNFKMHDHVATGCLTPRDLLCHRSGLPRHDVVWYGRSDRTRAQLVESLRHLQPSKPFRSTWQYNNLMYVTAGHLCEILTGSTWEELVRRRIFGRAGLTASTFSHEESGELGEVCLPYARRKSEVTLIPYRSSSDATGPAGSIYSTLADMSAWLRLNLDGGKLGDQRVLSEDTVRQLHAPQMVMSEQSFFPEVYDSAYGLGWHIGNYRGRKVVHHGGNIDGFTSLVTMLPGEGAGVVVLANKGATLIRGAIAYHVFDELLGLDPLPWGQRLVGLEQAMVTGAKEAKRLADRVEGTTPAHPLEDYAGSYEHPAYGSLDVEIDGDRLRPKFRDLDVSFEHRHYDLFDLEIEEVEDAQLTATFHTSPDGTITSMSAPLEPTVDPIVFARVPDPMPPAEVCERIAGTYAMGPLDVTIEFAAPDRLVGRIPGSGAYALVPYRGLKFRVEGLQHATATFKQEDGRFVELLLQPVGVLRRKDARTLT